MNLHPEVCVTRYSLLNAEMLIKEKGIPLEIRYRGYPEKADYFVEAHWIDGTEHTFTGFSAGYRGEGPHGFLHFLKLCGMDVDIEFIVNLPIQKNSQSYVVILPRIGKVVEGFLK